MICKIFGHVMGTAAGRGSWYDRCPRYGECVLRPVPGDDPSVERKARGWLWSLFHGR